MQIQSKLSKCIQTNAIEAMKINIRVNKIDRHFRAIRPRSSFYFTREKSCRITATAVS